jgi:MerR family transcriptional regulator, mercuric resistance operon regulatory protein
MPRPTSQQSLTIARLAHAAAVTVETVRYYQRRGLIPQPQRPLGGVRHYTDADAEQLRFIKRAQAMGFTLEEVKGLLTLRTQRSCNATRALAVRKVQLIDANIRELRQLRNELTRLVAACDANADNSCCPVIERLGHH